MTGSGRAGDVAATAAIYLGISVPGHLLWEMLQLPLYTIWRAGTPGEIAFAVAHCAGGDLLIAAASLALGMLLVGRGWPERSYARVAAAAIAAGVAYTIFSEWWNISVRGSWAYSDAMPTIPPLGTGLAPLLQWVVVPLAAFGLARRARGRRSRPTSAEDPRRDRAHAWGARHRR